MRMMIGTLLGALLLSGTASAQAPAQPKPAPAPPAKPSAPATPPAAQTPAPAPTAKPPAAVPFPADAKVGFINMQFIISESKLGKTGFEQIQSLSSKQTAERTARQNEIQKLQQELQAGSSVLTPQALSEKQADLDRRTREAQFQAQQHQVDLENLNKRLIEDFQQKVLPIVEKLREERGLWLIFTEETPIAAGHPGLNLSDEVIKRLDAAS
jgi:outer membrane protein